MPVFNQYNYEPLSGENAIRLMVLDPTPDRTAPLSCQIIEQSETEPHENYAAVSYVWGDAELSRSLEIRSDEDVKYLRIKPNVEALLQHLRATDEPWRLWIDAICVNQNDAAEKAQQVPRMGDIYRKAETVAIWLGAEDCMTTKLFAFFRKLSRLPDVTKWKTQWEMAGRIVFLMKKFIHHDNQVSLDAVWGFFQRPWFSRRWIIQEACLSNYATVHCGSQSIPLSLLSVAATRFQRLDMSDYHIKVAANLGGQTAKLSMLELLWHFHEAVCLEPKDRLAALLSLGPDGNRVHLDYTKPWTEIYKDFASLAYGLGKNNTSLQLLLHLFEFGSVATRADTSYPSWVPDWSHSRHPLLPYDACVKNLDTFEAYPISPGYSQRATINFHNGSLRVHWTMSAIGVRSYRVASAVTLNTLQDTAKCKTTQVADLMKRLFPSIPRDRLGILALASLLKRISDFRHPIAQREGTSKSLGKFERRLCNHFPDADRERLLVWLRTLDSVLQEFCLVELDSFRQCKVPGRGYGVGPGSMQVGDVVLPLWNLNENDPRSESFINMAGTGFQMFTMLVIRYVEDHPGTRGTNKPTRVGRVIGPVVCITFTEIANSSEMPFGPGVFSVVQQEEWSSIRII